MSNYICQYCERDCHNSGGLKVHERSCELNPNKITLQHKNSGPYERHDYICPYCGREFLNYTIQSFKRHTSYCKLNPNGKIIKPMAQWARDNIKNRAKQKPYHHSQKIKQKLSEIAKQNHVGGYIKGSGRGKKGWYNGFWCDSTYELAYLIYCLDHNINIKRNQDRFQYKLNGNTYNYIPDFIVDDTYVEIKGYHTQLVDIKISCVNKPIKVLYGKDLTYVFEYIKEKYNKYKDKNIHELYNGIKNFGETNIGGVACS